MAALRLRRRRRGQTMVEFALAFPVFVGLFFSAIQLGLLLLLDADQARLTDQSTRWLAIHANASDDSVAAAIQGFMLPTMVSGTPRSQGIETSDPSNVDNDDNASAVYQIGPQLTAKFTPCLPDASGNCTHRDRSSDGGVVHVELSYDASNVIFLPRRVDLPFLVLGAPTNLPSYREWMAAE